MNFTREPIIETVITPREGCKLVVRSSKGVAQEDYQVDAVEVVSFGHSFFFRSQERPKSFLVPVSDYEILELKETRMVLKNVSPERAIKIGGGREAAPPRIREEQPPQQDPTLSESRPAPQPEQQQQRPMGKRDKRRRGRRGRDRHEQPPLEGRESRPEMREHEEPRKIPEDHLPPESHEEFPVEQPVKAPSFISKLFPPPPTLIKESLSRYKTAETSVEEKIIQEDKSTFEERTSDQDLEDENEE